MSKPGNIPDQDILWKRMSFKGNKVWAACDTEGAPLARNNKVRIKYNLDQNYEYWIKQQSLKPEDQAVPAAARQKKGRRPARPGTGNKIGCRLPD